MASEELLTADWQKVIAGTEKFNHSPTQATLFKAIYDPQQIADPSGLISACETIGFEAITLSRLAPQIVLEDFPVRSMREAFAYPAASVLVMTMLQVNRAPQKLLRRGYQIPGVAESMPGLELFWSQYNRNSGDLYRLIKEDPTGTSLAEFLATDIGEIINRPTASDLVKARRANSDGMNRMIELGRDRLSKYLAGGYVDPTQLPKPRIQSQGLFDRWGRPSRSW